MPRYRALQCPFCDNYLVAPREIRFKSMEITGGICRCGGVYVLDRSGHALGEIFMDALTFACKGDLDRALSMDYEEYETVEMDYYAESNTMGRIGTGKRSKIMFVRIREGG